MSSICINPKITHEECGSSNLQMFKNDDDSITGFCFGCEKPVTTEYTDWDEMPKKFKLGKTKEQIKEEMANIKSCKALDLPARGLKAEDLKYFGIKVGLSYQDGKTPNIIYFPYAPLGKPNRLGGYNCKLIDPKRFWGVGKRKEVELFGWTQAIKTGSPRLYITEGELDAVALHKIFKRYQAKGYTVPAVCSLPHGAGNAEGDLKRVRKQVDKYFKEVFFVFDDDDAGQDALERACEVYPDAKSVVIPAKDVNQALLDKKGKEVFNAAYWDASKPSNSRLVYAHELHEVAKTPAEFGVSWPWPEITALTRGIRGGETTYIAAAEKLGKSEVVNALGAWLIKEHGWPILLAKPEEANKKSYKMLLSKIVGKIFHDPEVEFDEEAYDEAGEVAAGKLVMINLYQHVGWKSLQKDIVMAADGGVKAVFIDPITNLTNGLSSSEINTALMGIAQDLAAMAKDLDIHIFIMAHVNKAAKGKTPWDRGGVPTTGDFAGSSAMARSCNYAFVLTGNKDPELPEAQRNMRELHLLADREFGEVGIVRLLWTKVTGMFRQV